MGEGSETKRTKMTNQSNEKVAQMNIDYQKEYNQQVFDREDTANQRAVADMRAAGLNPLANYAPLGSGGVSAAPQSNMQYQTGESKLQEQLNALQSGLSIAESLQNQGLGIQQMQQNDAALKSANLANRFAAQTYGDRVLMEKYRNFSSQLDLKRANYDYAYRRYYGIHDGDDADTIRAKVLARQFIDNKSGSDSTFETGYYHPKSDMEVYSTVDLDSGLDNDLQKFAAAYGELSDKVLDGARDIVQSYLKGAKGAKKFSKNNK